MTISATVLFSYTDIVESWFAEFDVISVEFVLNVVESLCCNVWDWFYITLYLYITTIM